MCRELEALRQSIRAYSHGFDARSLIPDQAREVVRLCSEIKACVTSIESLAAAVGAEASSYKAEGYRSPEEQLARRSGMSPTQARRVLATGRRLLDQPAVAAAALSGQLSAEQTAAVSAGVEANPAKAAELIRLAGEVSLPELNEAVARVRAQAVDLEARRRAIHARRTLSRFTDVEGVYHAYLSGDPDDGITIDQVLTEIRRQLTLNRRERQIPNDTMAALDYDAMTALFDLALGKDCEVTLEQLHEIGLFPRLDLTATGATTAAGPAPSADRGRPAHDADPASASASTPTAHATAAAGPAQSSGPAGAPAPPPTAAGAAGSPTIAPAADLLSFLADESLLPAAGPPSNSSPPEVPAAGPSSTTAPPERRPANRPAAKPRLPGRPARVIVRIDLDALLRGYPREGELCDIPGYGPVPVSMIHDLMDSGQARLAMALTKGTEVLSVYLPRRHPNEYQKTALDLLYPVCAVKGCNTRAGMQADHREDWSRTHYTVLDLLDYLCRHHHDLKTNHGWALVPGRGKRDFVPPSDPRHGDHHRQPTGPGRAPPESTSPELAASG